MSASLRPHVLKYTRLRCPSPTPWACSNSCPLSWWCHPTISSSVIPFSSCLQTFPASVSFSNESFLLSRWGVGQSMELLLHISPSNGYSGLISFRIDWFDLLASKGLSRVFSNTTVQKHQFFGAQLYLWIETINWIINIFVQIPKEWNCIKPDFLVVVQLLSQAWFFVTPWTTACQTSLSLTISQYLLKVMSSESIMPSNYLILCHHLLPMSSFFPSIRVFSNESVLIRWPVYWSFSFSISPSNEYPGLSSFRIYLFDLLEVQRILKSLLQKKMYFSSQGTRIKVGSQEIPGVTGKFGPGVQNETGERLTEFCQENAQVIADTLFQQHKRQLYTWTSPNGQYRNQIDYILCNQRWRSSIQSAKTRLGANCGSDHELLLQKIKTDKVKHFMFTH